MADYKNQHYLPQFYLKGFTDPVVPGQLHVLKSGHEYWTRRGVRSVASQEYLHSFRDESGELNHELEKAFGRLEAEFKPILDKLLHRQELTEDEEMTFALFVMTMWQRVPTNVDHWSKQWDQVWDMAMRISHAHYQDPSTLEAFKAKYREETGSNDLDDLRAEDLDPERVSVRTNPIWTLVNTLESAAESADIILQMEWRFIMTKAPDFFITSDHPFSIFDPTRTDRNYGVGLAHENAELCLPLSKNMAFFAGWKSPLPGALQKIRCYLPVPKCFVEQINYRTAGLAKRELIAAQRNFPGASHIVPGWKRRNSLRQNGAANSSP